MSTRIIQNSFVGGELSPACWGRHDLEAYYKGAAKLSNFMSLKTGGARKRYGIRATDTTVGDYLPTDRTFKLIPYRYDRVTCAVFLLTTPLSGNSQLRLVDKSLGWTADPYGAMELDFRVEPEDMPSVRSKQVGDTIFLCWGASHIVRKLLVNREDHSDTTQPFVSVSAVNDNASTRACYNSDEWDTDYCPISLSLSGIWYIDQYWGEGFHQWIGGTSTAMIASSGIPFKYLVVPVFSDGHEIFPETPALESAMEYDLFVRSDVYDQTVKSYPKYQDDWGPIADVIQILVRAQFYTDKLPTSVKIFRSDTGNFAGLKLLATVTPSAPISTTTVNGRTVGTYQLATDNLKALTSGTATADRAVNGWEHTANYYAVGVTGSTVYGVTAANKAAAHHVSNNGLPDSTHKISVSVSCVKTLLPDTINVYRSLLGLSEAASDADKIASINTTTNILTTQAGTAAITPVDSEDGLTTTYTLTDNGTEISGGGTYAPAAEDGFEWTHYTASISEAASNAKPSAPTSITAVVKGMTGSYVKHYAAYGVSSGVYSDKVTANANIATSWTAGAYVTLKVVFPVSRNYDSVTVGKMSAGVYGVIATVYPGDSGWVEAGDTVTVTVTDDNVTPSDAIYSQENLIESDDDEATADGLYASNIAVFQQRLVGCGGNGIPFSLQLSGVGDLYNFWVSRPAQTDEAFQLTLATTSPADIRHVLAFRTYLLCFTDGGVYRVQGGNSGFSGSSNYSDEISDIGCEPNVEPVATVSGILFVAADQRTVYELVYDISQDNVIPVERSVLADHLTAGNPIRAAAHQRYPQSILWCVLDDGTLAGMTYQPEQKVYAWHRHSVPNARIIDAVATDTVTDALADGDTVSDILFAAVGADGKTRLCVFDGSRTDTASGTETDVAAELVTLRPELPNLNTQGILKNILGCMIRVRNTERISVAPGDGTDNAIAFETKEPANGDEYTGNVKLSPRGNINQDGNMTIRSASGPCEIQCVVWEAEF